MTAEPTVWGVTMVRDEMDILPFTLAHMASEGLDGIIVADNLSTDGTWEWLRDDSFIDIDTKVVVQRDVEVGYYQARKMTALAHQAFALGADWVIPFDADELWYNALEPVSLADTLRRWPARSDCLLAKLFNYYGTSLDDTGDPVAFTRINRRDPLSASLNKVIVHNRPDQVIDQGNHLARGDEPYLRHESPFEIAHFPWRTVEQFVRKVRNGAQAYIASDLPLDMGAHWRQYGETLDRGGEEAVNEIFTTWFFDPDAPLEYRPAPYCRMNL